MTPHSFRTLALAVSLTGHAWVVSLFASWTPIDRERPPLEPGLLISGDGFSRDRSILVFIEERGTAREVDRPAPPSLELAGTLALRIRRHLTEFPDMSELEDASGTANAAEPAPIDGTDSSALLQRYVGQIQARIDRAWDLPAGQRDGRCSVEITQGPDGQVLDLQLTECDLDDSARQTLVAAVRRASPLPAPPDARLFLSQDKLHFSSLK